MTFGRSFRVVEDRTVNHQQGRENNYSWDIRYDHHKFGGPDLGKRLSNFPIDRSKSVLDG